MALISCNLISWKRYESFLPWISKLTALPANRPRAPPQNIINLQLWHLSVSWNSTVCPDQLILFMGTVLFKIRKNGRFKMCFATMSTTPKNCDNKSNRLQTHCTPPNVPKHSASKCLVTPLWPTFTIMSILALVFVINLVCRRQHNSTLHFAVDLPKFGSITTTAAVAFAF